jgi:hypothetical protein
MWILCLAFPDDDRAPPKFGKKAYVSAITLYRSLKFLSPEARSCFRHAAVGTTPVAMPKTPIYKNHEAVLREHQVGTSR